MIVEYMDRAQRPTKQFLNSKPKHRPERPGKIDPFAPPTRPRKPLRVRGSHSNTVYKRPPHHSACYMSCGPMSQVLERQQHWLTCSQYLCPQMHAHGGFVAAEAMRTVSSIMRLWLLSWGYNVFAEAHGHHGYAKVAALGWSICVQPLQLVRVQYHTLRHPARPVAQHQNPAKRRTFLVLLSHGYLFQSCWRRAVALGRWSRRAGPARPGARERGRK